MQLEIERKWLLRKSPNIKYFTRENIIIQQYSGDLRIREEISSAGSVYTATKKEGRGLTRVENEVAIPHWLYATLWARFYECPMIRKSRFYTRQPGVTVDVFSDNLEGLVLLEAEFKSEEKAKRWNPPPYLRKLIIKEVTDNSRYVNLNLAKEQQIPTQL